MNNYKIEYCIDKIEQLENAIKELSNELKSLKSQQYQQQQIHQNGPLGEPVRQTECTCARYEHNVYVCPLCRGGGGTCGTRRC